MAYGRGRAVVSTPIGIGPVRRRPRSAPNGFASKLRVAETKLIGPFLSGAAITIADCVAMALIEFADQFYDVSLPPDRPKLTAWYRRMRRRPSTRAPTYPEALLVVARGLPEQTQVFI